MKFLRFTVFTLIELLIVISIIAILMSLLLPSLNTARGVAKRSFCAGNMRQLSVVLVSYAGDYDGLLPPLTGVAATSYLPYWPKRLLDEGYFSLDSQARLLSCPAMPRAPASFQTAPHTGLNSDLMDYSKAVSVGTSFRIERATQPSTLILGADARQCDTTTGINPNFDGFFRIYSSLQTSGAWGYPDPRHNGFVNVLWLDCHNTAIMAPKVNPYLAAPFNSVDSWSTWKYR